MERRLAAILCADVHGYSRLMGDNEEATVQTLSEHRRIIDDLIRRHHGRFVNSAGDSVLAEFPSVVNAVECAVGIQTALATANAPLSDERRMNFRIGLNLGDVIVDGEQIYGDGVNVAARLESLAEPGGINISGSVQEQIKNKLALNYEDLGKQRVKNITEPVRVFRVMPGVGATRKTRKIPRRYLRRTVLSLAGIVVIAAILVLVQHVSLRPQRTAASVPPVQGPALALPDKPSIAVLPFANMSEGHEQEYFSDGITDQLITDLSRLPGLFVIASSSSFTYKGKPTKLQDVGKELGVKYVLQGSVRKSGERVRVSVQLADATSGAELWAERYDRPLKDVFAIQDEIVRRIVTTLNLQLDLAQQGVLIPRSTDNLEAYDDLLRGTQYLLRFTRDDNLKAREMLEKAIKLDPKYAMAYSVLGNNYYQAWIAGYDPNRNSLNKALQMEQRALVLDNSLSGAHSILALIYVRIGQANQALIEAKRGIALNPNSADAYRWLAEALNILWNPADALEAVEKAMRLDPRNPDFNLMQRGFAYYLLGRTQEAISDLTFVTARHPDSLWAHVFLVGAYRGLGDEKNARAEAAEVERILALNPESAMNYSALSDILNSLGEPAEALAAAEKAEHLDSRLDFYQLEEGRAYTAMGRWQEAAIVLGRFHTSHPDDFWSHVFLAIDYMELGKDKAARAEAAQVLKLNPMFSPSTVITTGAETERAQADLRKAGLN
jgi:adenylate cyclase